NSLVHLQGQYLTVCELDYNIVQVEIQNTPKTKETVEIGAFCLVEDISGYWYRGRVQNRRNDVFDVFLIDNGTILSVDASHLASASDELFMLPPKVVCGFFSNIQPTGEKWGPLAVKYFLSLHGLEVKGYIQSILPHKVLVLEVPDVNKEVIKLGLGKAVDKDTFLLLVEMLTELPLKQNSEPVPDLLIERHTGQEYSFKPSSFHSFQNVVASCGPQVTIGKTERVKLTSAINAGTFYCQLMHMSLDLQEVTEKLSYCCESKCKELCETPTGNVGVLCAVKGKDEKWHRGFVQQVLSNGHARVLFVDYGFCESVKAQHILQLPPDFHSAPIMSFPCALSCLTELDEELQKQQMNELKKGLLTGILYIRPDSFKPDHHLYYVTLLSPLDGADQGFQKESCKRQPFTGPYGKPTFSHTVQENSIQEMCKTDNWDISNRKPTAKATYKVKELEDGSVFVGYVEHVLNPSDFWIRTDDHNSEFEEMMKNIVCFYDSLELDEGILDNPEPGLLCCAMFEKDMHYYRAVIVDVFENGAEVFFLDFGNTDKVPYMCIKTLPLRFAEVPALAFHCSLAHLVPVEDVWTANATSVFRTAVLNKVLLVHVVQKRKDKYIVDLHDKEIESKCSVITLLVQAGLAEYWKEMSADYNQKLAKASWDQQSKRKKHKNVSFMQSQHNSKSKETSPVQSVARPGKVPCNSYTEDFLKLFTSASVSSEQRETKVPIKPQIFKVGCVLDVKISSIDSPSEFWCQVKNQLFKMELLMEDIQCYYRLHADPFQPGELACVAKCSKDGKWYRGCVVQQMQAEHAGRSNLLSVTNIREGHECLARSEKECLWHRAEVEEIFTESEEVSVAFFDHGATERISISDIKELADDLKHVPRQAILCKWRGCEKLNSESGEMLNNYLKPLMDQEIKLLFVSVFNSPPVWEVEIMIDGGLLVHHVKDTISVRDEEIRKSIPKLGDYLQNGDNVNDTTPPQSLTLAPVQTNKEYSGFAAAVIDPSEFFIELEDMFLTMNTVSMMLAELPDDLAALPVGLIKPGSCCLVNSESKNKWCRAEITEVANNSVQTTLVDYGHCSPVPYSSLNEIKKLPEELARLPKLTYPCLLRGVKPINGEHWTDEAIIFFQECICRRNLIIYFRRYVFEALWEVDILIGDVDIANELAAAGHAAYIENMPLLRKEVEKPSDSYSQMSPNPTIPESEIVNSAILSLLKQKHCNEYLNYGSFCDENDPNSIVVNGESWPPVQQGNVQDVENNASAHEQEDSIHDNTRRTLTVGLPLKKNCKYFIVPFIKIPVCRSCFFPPIIKVSNSKNTVKT
ncbi:tudor domain-containing protein 15-like, partial [Acipenser oxyrinchus oxyrinchus]